MRYFFNVHFLLDPTLINNFRENITKDQDNQIEIYVCGEHENYFCSKTSLIKHIFKNKQLDINVVIKIQRSKFIVITGLSKFNSPSSTSSDKYPNVIFHHWDTYWLTKTYYYIKDCVESEYTKHYICMNGRARNHRARLLDNLYHNDMFKYGNLTWNNGHAMVNQPYEFKYWNPIPLRLDITEDMISKMNNNVMRLLASGISGKSPMMYNLPLEYHSSFMQIVTETRTDLHYITEKTSIPLILKKPFLALSSKGYHNNLTKYGFQLYDEIFDYSFDECDDIDDRVNGIIKNVQNISSHNLTDCKLIYEKVNDKLSHNRELAIKLAKDKTIVPSVCMENKNNMPWNSECYKILMEADYE